MVIEMAGILHESPRAGQIGWEIYGRKSSHSMATGGVGGLLVLRSIRKVRRGRRGHIT
jgi:hypothetical protein